MSSAASWINVANSALTFLGEPMVESFTDNLSAKLCGAHIYRARNIVLRKYPFNSARKDTGPMAPTTELPVDPHYGYSFQLPADILRVVKFTPGFTEYKIVGNQLLCNESTINMNYVWAIDNPTVLVESVTEAIALYLAWAICYKITESLPLRDALQKDYRLALAKARNEDSMENYPEAWEAVGFLSSRFAGTVYDGPYGNETNV